ncbi:MAG: lipoyl(octanoyl) transferase LipB [Gammaproteobacteria bacterium]|nr:MAG: lipoyl(octanoyl) transferase LipB [Gammaproteobacteria bacterium]
MRVRRPGLVDYRVAFDDMVRFTMERDPGTPDELWLLQHPPVFTLGMNADPAHVLDAGDIPVVRVDRGGQVTYHGPGQVVAYVLLDLGRRHLGVRALVSLLEDVVVATLARYDIRAASRPAAPGVYVDGAKIASLGLRVRRGASYHGLALNVDMDLAPFARINPCGYPGIEVTQVAALGGPADADRVSRDLEEELLARL